MGSHDEAYRQKHDLKNERLEKVWKIKWANVTKSRSGMRMQTQQKSLNSERNHN